MKFTVRVLKYTLKDVKKINELHAFDILEIPGEIFHQDAKQCIFTFEHHTNATPTIHDIVNILKLRI